ncbi:hypothetical protein [Sphaerisporangium sp. TRM90804]|uniref:hypothetical protein n=1 Tax=Sphaerisporangium sp. TRM90804 TaxID=3031113 RepID=UPI00244C62CC|nr:hypothetical protein [Sphaerisporangium sp. TRM90804]MDH2429569.1 hypothetical protein [Sphaerisporangium sp. TRM90804]
MIVLGLLLIVLAGAGLIAVANDETGGVTASITVLDRTLQLTNLELFLAGAATAAVFLIGLMMLTGGMRRAGVRRKKAVAARAETRDRVARLEEEKRRLERKLEKESAATAETPAGKHANVPDRDGDGVPDRTAAPASAEPVVAGGRPAADRQPATDQLVAGNPRRDSGV